MALKDFGSGDYSEQAVDQHGKKLLDKYGEEACNAAARIESMNISEDTARSYKPQIREIVAQVGDSNPDPTDALDVIVNTGKKPSTKNIMVLAMKKYYQRINEPDRGEELHKQAKNEGVAEIDFNNQMEVEEWIKKSEVERIEEHILPKKGSTYREISGTNESYIITLEHKALVMTLFYTGARVGEVCARNTDDIALKVEDLYPESDQIELYRLKKQGTGYKRDMKVVPGKLWDVLDEYLDEYGIEEGAIFPFVKRTAQNRITDIHDAYTFCFGEFEHMEKLTPHKFRHGRITDLANHAGLEDAGQYVQHSSTEVTNAYRHLASEQQRDILPEESDDTDASISELQELLDEYDDLSIDEAIEMLKSQLDT